MRIIAIGLGDQRPPDHFRELIGSGPVFARNAELARTWLSGMAVELHSLDDLFDTPNVTSIPSLLVETFRRAVTEAGTACYIVPGAGNTGDASVNWLARACEVEVFPGKLEYGGLLASCRIVDALALAIAEEAFPFDAGREALDPAVMTVVTNFRGTNIRSLATARLERELGRDGWRHDGDLLIVDAVTEPAETAAFSGLEAIIARLRSPDGCPWDREQTIDSLLPQLDEELDEFRDAWKNGTPEEQAGELGDVLLHIVMMAQIARETSAFNSADVIRAISAKMVRRHPHVFGDVRIESIDELYVMWDEIKRQEKADEGVHSS